MHVCMYVCMYVYLAMKVRYSDLRGKALFTQDFQMISVNSMVKPYDSTIVHTLRKYSSAAKTFRDATKPGRGFLAFPTPFTPFTPFTPLVSFSVFAWGALPLPLLTSCMRSLSLMRCISQCRAEISTPAPIMTAVSTFRVTSNALSSSSPPPTPPTPPTPEIPAIPPIGTT
jgi:hypothetical protein